MTVARTYLVALSLLLVSAVLPAQTNRFEKTIPYRLDQSQKLDAKVGPVMIDNVKITNMGRGFGRGGFGPKGMQPSEGSTTLRFAFDVNNPGEDWEITFTLEFYDKAGSSDKTLKLYEGHFHDLLADVGKQQVMADVQAWIDAHLGTDIPRSRGELRT